MVVCAGAVGWRRCFRCWWPDDYRLADRKHCLRLARGEMRLRRREGLFLASSCSVSKEHQTMTRIKIVGLAVLAACAVMAVAAASAMAAENPVLVKSNGEAVTNVTATGASVAGTVSTLQTTAVGAGKVECTKGETSRATVSTRAEGTGMTSGTATVTFTGCKTAAGSCENTGPAGSKEITGTVSMLLVWVGKEANKTIGLLFSTLPYTGSPGSQNGLLSSICSGELVDIQGSFIALTKTKIGEASTHGSVIAKSTGGRQEDLTYTENGVTGTNTIYSNQNHGAFSAAGEEIETEETYSTIVKVIES
jgi:hypothetical protein